MGFQSLEYAMCSVLIKQVNQTQGERVYLCYAFNLLRYQMQLVLQI